MDEGPMDVVEGVLDAVEVVARPHPGPGDPEDTGPLQLREAPHGRRLAFAQIGEDQPEILLHGVAANLDALAEGLGLGGLLDTLAVGSIDPPVVEAAQII